MILGVPMVMERPRTIPPNHRYLGSIVLAILLTLGFDEYAISEQRVLIGWLEKVYLPTYDITLKAKMDTGAKNSSIHAVDIRYANEKEGGNNSRVRFTTVDAAGAYREIIATLVGEARIKKSRPLREGNLAIDLETRPVVELEICLAGLTKRIRVNLTNRAGMNYRMILGRSALGGFVVDAGQTFSHESGCGKK
jgi:hypothetical protein